MKIKKNNNINSEYLGVYKAVNKNFGLVILDLNILNTNYKENKNDDKEKVFVYSENSKFAMEDDIVLVRITKPKTTNKSAEGEILKIVKKQNKEIIGIFEKSKDFGFVVPINKKIQFDLHIQNKFTKNAVDGSIVSCTILNTNDKNKHPEAVINYIIGHKNDPSDVILSIVKDFGIRTDFSDELLNEANKVAKEITDDDIKNRVDLRDKKFFTIDGEDAKDLDDAICIEKENNNYIVYVSIADVSHYVKENSFLDEEAKKRGNSVYLLDRVIPMLPHVLSNGMCSLNELEDRLVLTCKIVLDENANTISSEVFEAIINSKKRMSYTCVHAIFNNIEVETKEDINSYNDFKNELELCYELHKKLRDISFNRGAVELNLYETKIIVDDKLKPIDVVKYERYEAHKIIEDFMILANECVAKEFFYKEIPFLYRVHEEPDIDKIEKLSRFLSKLSIILKPKMDMKPKAIQNIIETVKNKSYQYIVEKLVLRSMKQARYSNSNLGHFALALKHYTHFTSPIRRYNDLQIHRIIKECIHNEMNSERITHYNDILNDIADSISDSERIAIDCEREVVALKSCEYMSDKIGEEFIGTISSVTNFGFFVELDNNIEGLVSIKSLKDDMYEFYDDSLELIAIHNRNTFTIGQKVKVKLFNVSIENKNIDFEYIGNI